MHIKSKELADEIERINQQLQTMPEGKLICSHTGPYYKWEVSDGHTKTYIKKKDRAVAEKLAEKKYIAALLEDKVHEKRAIDLYLKHHSNYEPKAEKLLTDSLEAKELLSPYFTPVSKELDDWKNSPYKQNPYYPEYKKHKASSGNIVRSKSEALIDMILYTKRIPFRYECELQLNDITIYPDFTIRHPKMGNVIYWEHFGKMDDPKYNRKVGDRIQTYVNNGIIPSIHLITTYETQDNPLSMQEIEKIVKDYFDV